MRAVALVLLTGLAASPAASQPSVASVLAESPFSASERSSLLAGRTVVQALAEAGNRELAVGAACLLAAGSVEDALAPFLSDRPILPEEHVLKSGVLRGKPSPELFRPIRLEPDVAAEVARYLKARPGTELNLSAEEIADFTAIEPSPRTAENIDRVHTQLRAFLARRYASYRERGLEGIPDYARARGSRTSPADELRRSTRAAGLHLLAPAYEKAWLGYPRGVPAEAGDTYFWAQVEVDGRPAVTIAHRLSLRDGATHLVGQRSFYISHFFDSGESLVAVAAVEEGTLVLYQDRIWMDQLSGLSGRVKKTLGRKFLANHVEQVIESLGVCPK
jgi:hypothetical protein